MEIETEIYGGFEDTEEKHSSQNVCWTPEITEHLLEIRLPMEKEFNTGNSSRSNLWNVVTQKLKKIDPTLSLSSNEVRKKYNNLMVTYKRNKMRQNKCEDDTINWVYFDMFDQVYGSKHKANHYIKNFTDNLVQEKNIKYPKPFVVKRKNSNHQDSSDYWRPEDKYKQKRHEIKMKIEKDKKRIGMKLETEIYDDFEGQEETISSSQGFVWTASMIKLLLGVRFPMQKAFNTGQISRLTLWNMVTQKMKKLNPTFSLSCDEVRRKYNNLMVIYKRNKAKKHKFGEEAINWPYFDMFDQIYGTRHKKNHSIENLLNNLPLATEDNIKSEVSLFTSSKIQSQEDSDDYWQQDKFKQKRQKKRKAMKKDREENHMEIETAICGVYEDTEEELTSQNIFWTASMTKNLLEIRLPMEKEFSTGEKTRSTLWNIVTQKMKKKEPRLNLNSNEIRKKFNNLMLTYKRNKTKEKISGESTSNWPYYDLFDQIYGTNDILKYSNSDESTMDSFAEAPYKNIDSQVPVVTRSEKNNYEDLLKFLKHKNHLDQKRHEEIIAIENDKREIELAKLKKLDEIKNILLNFKL